jgi:hypothetical protein
MSSGTHEFLPFDDGRWYLDTAIWRGVTNGLSALRWVPIVDVEEPLVASLLAALAGHGVPARAEPRTRRGVIVGKRWRVWVDAVTHAQAEEILRVELSAHGPA